ncbi:hypothetical protein HNQ51_000156 [Inhella inkyongensis]|uniref:IPT/TIG domain-containing protein n=1 Tax=Inhella inkyongensis TaxID=392593 RepID=A0A840RZ83_9BURK|nr:hypothetical protein [Inhella inkyongensis]MBB5202863.1 hypothetical protein [Inhella inkyongensis]
MKTSSLALALLSALALPAASAQSSAPNLECSTDHAAWRTVQALVQAYERGDIAALRARMEPNQPGLQQLLDAVLVDFHQQKQLRIHLKDINLQCGPDVTVVQASWEKRFLSVDGFKPGLLTGRVSWLLHRQQEKSGESLRDVWRVAASGGSSPLGTAAGGSPAELDVGAALDLSRLTASATAGALLPPINLPLLIEVREPDWAGRARLQVTVTTDRGDRELFSLNEVAPGRFQRNELPVNAGTARPGDGALQVQAGERLTVRYADPNPGNGRPATVLTRSLPTTGTPFVPDALPDPFAFTPVLNAALGALVSSNIITLSGTNTPTTVGIVGGLYSINGGAFTSAPGMVPPGAQLQVRVDAANSPSTPQTAVLTVGGQSASFTVTTVAADTTPDPFTFAPQTGVALGAQVDSAAVTLSGTNAPAPISVLGGSYSVNGGPFTSSPGLVAPGAIIRLRATASSLPSTTVQVLLTVGGVAGSFNVSTLAADITPDPFSFAPQSNVAPGITVQAAPITVSGVNAPTPISVVGGSYSINGGPFTTAPGTVLAGQSVALALQSSALTNGAGLSTATLQIGTVSAAFVVTTWDAQPNPFSWPNALACGGGTVDSAPLTVSGISTAVPISITSGAGTPAASAQYSINGGAFTSAPGTVSNGQTVVLRVTRYFTINPLTVRATVNINGVTGTWSTSC